MKLVYKGPICIVIRCLRVYTQVKYTIIVKYLDWPFYFRRRKISANIRREYVSTFTLVRNGKMRGNVNVQILRRRIRAGLLGSDFWPIRLFGPMASCPEVDF